MGLNENILLEDDKVDAKLFERMLEKLGFDYELTIGNTCQDAHKLIAEFNFEFAVLDQNVPDRTGLELLSTLNQPPR